MTIGDRIKSARMSKDFTLEYVGDRIGVTRATIQKYENGLIANIPSDKISALAIVLGVSPAYIMGWEEKKSSPSEPVLTEGEKTMLELFRLVPEDKQQLVLQMIRVALNTPK